MNIFDKKLKESNDKGLPTNPIELYQTCNYQEGYGYLRGIQEEVLRAWDKIRTQRDVICKMNTGSGKTLTGLLMLYSKLVELREPVLYLCPDIQLTEQTILQAALYGIPVCSFETNKPAEIPLDFLNSKKILVCSFQKLFNGRSIFIRKNIKIGAIVVDDAHKCVDVARNQSSLQLPRSNPISKKLFELFEPALKYQLKGTFARLRDGDPYLSMKVPYWAWMDNHETILEIINSEVDKISAANVIALKAGKETDDTPLKWQVIVDHLLRYDCYIGGSNIEIAPIHVPNSFFTPFYEANHRYILSATFEDDYDLIKDLGITHESIVKPIVPSNRKDIGKRLILTPSRFDAKILDNELRDFIANYPRQGYNVVVLVPSKDQAANWKNKGATYVMKDNISKAIQTLHKSKGNFMVFANRYDGMDLYGDSCHLLVIDGLPKYNTIQEFYAETRLESLRAGKKAQIIEQGLGRAVRSGADHCVIYLMGSDLLSFLGEERNLDHFTPVTRAQVKLGLELLDGEEKKASLKIVAETAALGLNQDSKWTQYHSQVMQSVQPDSLDEKKMRRLSFAEVERRALVDFQLRKYVPSGQIIDEILNSPNIGHKEKAWYFQLAGQLTYLGDKSMSNDLQSKACLNSGNMLHPPLGHVYNKVTAKGAQASNLKNQLERFERPQDILNHIRGILNNLVYTPDQPAELFENALADLGLFLGFNSQTPEADTGVGPDVLWMLSDGHALILEAKSRRIGDEISKDNIEQLQQSELWFGERYGADAPYTAVTLQPNGVKGKNVFIKGHKVIDKKSLDLLHDNLLQFGTALQSSNPKSHKEEGIGKLLVAYNLTPPLFRSFYIKDIK